MATRKKAAKKKATKKSAAKKPATKKKTPTKKPAAKKPSPKKKATTKRSAARKPAAKKKAATKKKASPARRKKASPPRRAVAAKAPEPQVESPGWAAIDAACAAIHGEAPLVHYAPRLPMIAGGDDPLEGISVFRCDRGGPHWHFVTYGFSDLHEKSTDDPESSGFGFELTFRLRRGDETEPPAWACNVLQNLARYVFRTGNPFGVGHHVPLNGPIALGIDTEIHSVAFALDPELGVEQTPFGTVEFLQMVGITREEAKAIKRWSSTGILELLAARDPLMITSLDRPSLLEDPATRREIEARTKAEGSSSAASFTTQLAFEQGDDGIRVRLGAIAVEDLVALMEGRVAFGREFGLLGRGNIVSFRPADAAGWSVDATEITVDTPPELAREIIERVKPLRGVYRFAALPSLTLEILPTEIKDQEGNVTEVVG